MDHQVKGRQVPAVILNKFKADYPGEQPTWSKDGNYYRADFVDGKQMNGHAVAYDAKGNVIYREEQLAAGSYPEGISTYYSGKYPNEKYSVWSNTDKSGNTSYYSTHNMEVFWFDKDGNFRNIGKARPNNAL